MSAQDIASMEDNAIGDLIVVKKDCTIQIIAKENKKSFLERLYLEIMSRTDPTERFEDFECRDETGGFSEGLYSVLISERLRPGESIQ